MLNPTCSVFALILALAISNPLQAQDPLREDLNVLFRASHGIMPLSGEQVMAVWEKVKNHPEPYLPLLESEMDLTLFETGTEDDRARAQATAWMLGELNHPKAFQILARCFHLAGTRINTQQLTPPLTPAEKGLVALRRNLLEVMGQKGASDLIRTCRNMVEHEDYATQIVMRRYLSRVDPDWVRPLGDEVKK